jgi:sodium/potassium-transporting ATPase subunit alpha
LLKEGENKLSEKEGMNPFVEYLHHMANFFAMLMWAGAILCFIAFAIASSDASNLYLGIVIVAIVNISTFVEFAQNRKSKAMMESFKNFIPPETTVIRDGIEKSISSLKLVRGDLIKVELGKKIPADIRIVESNGMKVDNSSLTGETELLSRIVDCSNPDNPLETRNIAFFSTLNREGSGKGVVMFTGDNTFIGQIAGLAMGAEEEETPLNQEINRFVRRLGIAAVCLGILVLSVGLGIGFEPINALTLAIGITVANVPNGLLLEVTISLTLTAKRLAKKKVLAKKLQAVETLGCTTCICSDKTGTLTMNKMIAAHLMYSGRVLKANNKQKELASFHFEYDPKDPGFRALHDCATVCSVAVFDPSPPETEQERIREDKHLEAGEKEQKLREYVAEWEEKVKAMMWLDMPTIGDASESALIKFFQPIEDIKTTRARFPVIKNKEARDMRLLFSSVNKFAFSINRTPKGPLCLFTKGAPEKVWKMCTHVLVEGKAVPKDDHWEKVFLESNEYFGSQGERVLGFSQLELPSQYGPDYDYNID